MTHLAPGVTLLPQMWTVGLEDRQVAKCWENCCRQNCRRASRTAATMSDSFLVNKFVPRRLLEAGLEDADAVEGVFLFPFHLEVVDVDFTSGGGLARVDRLRLVEALIICFLLMCCCDFTQPHGTVHAFCSY